ncbi:OmpA family protein [Stenotrophomonas sp. SY1]|uniref:OmpA family protein n=1 Tax=Stenotrophomonas sp. SY1 TaxID=477235 RepID=UPI001E5B8E90|nr:OmpA family protein [Stenotrophomonas sp. SY1]MCD9085689.1 OmpA family protein [Stenotrophomonas sp. SY1]
MIKRNMLVAFVVVIACASPVNAALPVKVSGSIGDVSFPDKSHSYLSEGDFVSVGNLRQMRPGLGKDQVRLLLGNPHFTEGVFGSREWNYVFNFRTGVGEGYITCQYQVRYERKDGEYLAQSLHWDESACMDLLNLEPASVQRETSVTRVPDDRKYVLSDDLLFPLGSWISSEIASRGQEELQLLAKNVLESGASSLKIIGHTDRLGTEADNRVLSERRARSIRDYLVGRGVDVEMTSIEGRGESEPVKHCGNLPRSELIRCLAPNRRVEIMVTGSSL